MPELYTVKATCVNNESLYTRSIKKLNTRIVAKYHTANVQRDLMRPCVTCNSSRSGTHVDACPIGQVNGGVGQLSAIRGM